MMKFNKFRRNLLSAAVLAMTLVLTLAGCTKVDDTLGSNLVPDNQQMKAGFVTLDGKLKNGQLNPRKYVETRLYQTDSILASNITYGYMGSMLNDTLGLRSAGFQTQYARDFYYKLDSGYFGFRPIFDSIQLLLSIKSYGRDTTTEQTFAVYEITSNKYLTDKPVADGKTRDTTFYLNFNPEKEGIFDPGKPLFTFTLGKDKGPATKAVTMQPTTEGRAFVSRLMLQAGEYKDDYSIYSLDSLEQFVEAFKGLYIRPEKEQTEYSKGTIYATELKSSGFTIFARNRVEDDPSLIKDTVGMNYYFYDSDLKFGNVSINTVHRDYNLARTESLKIDLKDAQESTPSEERPKNPLVYVEGMGGVVTEMTFTKEFFEDLQAILDQENNDHGRGFTTLAFNQARMSIYFNDSDYDWQNVANGSADGKPLDLLRMTDQMNSAPSRLGLYTNYKKLSAISDYNYLYEANYDTELAYNGYINRSRGCYVMDISGHMQLLWNSYAKEAKAAKAEGREVDMSKVERRTVYIAPEAYSLFTPSSGVFQGMATDETSTIKNNASIRFDLAYNMIK